MKRLSDSESHTLYRALTNSIAPFDTFLQLLFETGARVSETLTLTSADMMGRSLTIAPLKNSLPRTVTVSANLEAKLRSLPPTWSMALATHGTPTQDSLRRALDRHYRGRTSQLLGREANLHSLRHTAFSRLYAATKDLLLVKQWAGHRSINSTMVYMQLDQQEEADRANEGLLERMG